MDFIKVAFNALLAPQNVKLASHLQAIALLVIPDTTFIHWIIHVFKIAQQGLILQALHARLVNIPVKIVYHKWFAKVAQVEF